MSKNPSCLFYKYKTFFLFAKHLKQKNPSLLERGFKIYYIINLSYHLLIGTILSYRQSA
jgi:hypothetical protein